MEEALGSVTTLDKKLQSRGGQSVKDPNAIRPEEYQQPVSAACRKKGTNRPKLTLHQKIEIVWKVLTQFYSNKEVAKEFRITPGYASLLVSKARKNSKFLVELHTEEFEKEMKERRCIDPIQRLVE